MSISGKTNKILTGILFIGLSGSVIFNASLFASGENEKKLLRRKQMTFKTEPVSKRILIITGEDHKAHLWQDTTPVLQRILEVDRRLSVEVINDLNILRSDKLHQYDAAVMHFKDYNPKVPGKQGWKNLEKYVSKGGGLVLVHFACGAFQERPGFVKVAGRIWNPQLRGHDPFGKFQVQINNNDHPVTIGMKSFETHDELYTCLKGETPIHILATAVSKVDHKTYPMAFVLTFGKGRIFHSTLGHNVVALKTSETGELYRRGCAWTVRLNPNVDSKKNKTESLKQFKERP